MNAHRQEKQSRPSRLRTLRYPARLGQGVEQIEPRIMLSGDAVVQNTVEWTSGSIAEGGYVDLASDKSHYSVTNSFTLEYLPVADSGFLAETASTSSLNPTVWSTPIATRSSHEVPLQQLVVFKPAQEGGFAEMALGVGNVVTTGAVSNGSHEAVAAGMIAPLVPSSGAPLGSDTPLEAGRGRSQTFELSANLQNVLRSAPAVNAQAVDAAIAQFGLIQPSLAKSSQTPQKNSPSGELTELQPSSSIDELLVAARKVEVQLAASQSGGAKVMLVSHTTHGLSDVAAMELPPRPAAAESPLPADGLVAVDEPRSADSESAGKSWLAPLLAFDNSDSAGTPGVWAAAVIVSLAGLYWQRSGVGQRWQRENEVPRLRRFSVRAAQ